MSRGSFKGLMGARPLKEGRKGRPGRARACLSSAYLVFALVLRMCSSPPTWPVLWDGSEALVFFFMFFSALGFFA